MAVRLGRQEGLNHSRLSPKSGLIYENILRILIITLITIKWEPTLASLCLYIVGLGLNALHVLPVPFSCKCGFNEQRTAGGHYQSRKLRTIK